MQHIAVCPKTSFERNLYLQMTTAWKQIFSDMFGMEIYKSKLVRHYVVSFRSPMINPGRDI